MCSGAIGTAAWTGVLLRDVLDRCSNLPLLGEEGSAIEDLCAQFVILRGRDMHTKGRQRYESSLPIAKVLDARYVGEATARTLFGVMASSNDHPDGGCHGSTWKLTALGTSVFFYIFYIVIVSCT